MVFACRGEAPARGLSEIERFACEVHPASARRLVRIHDRRSSEVSGTPAWLARLPCYMHHHLALQEGQHHEDALGGLFDEKALLLFLSCCLGRRSEPIVYWWIVNNLFRLG